MRRRRSTRSAPPGRQHVSGSGTDAVRWQAPQVDESAGQVIIDIDATLVDAHSDKQHAEPTHKRTFGFAPMCAFVDHGADGTGEPLALNLRPGKASPWKATDHITALDDALAQLPLTERAQVLVRTDAGGCSKAFLHHITCLLYTSPSPRDLSTSRMPSSA